MINADIKNEDTGSALTAVKNEDARVKPEDPERSTFLDKFTQLWFACYFERRLTKQKVEDTDLVKVVQDLIVYFETLQSTQQIDFRRTMPLIEGLHNLFVRKINYLLKDSESVLSQMNNPVAQFIKVEGSDQPNVRSNAKAAKTK